ncbi:hypothetical protein GCM10023323_03410 [Streptomyces thinghirensis]|uniref:Uncharacterized protein n=1 Tax=Streptomyces thinghirensis TaxID=551547 RepID=A0ABP9SWY8_9ACTN
MTTILRASPTACLAPATVAARPLPSTRADPGARQAIYANGVASRAAVQAADRGLDRGRGAHRAEGAVNTRVSSGGRPPLTRMSDARRASLERPQCPYPCPAAVFPAALPPAGAPSGSPSPACVSSDSRSPSGGPP